MPEAERARRGDGGGGAARAIDLPAGRLTVTVRAGSRDLDELCQFATRNNPRRAFLFVSRVLGRHLPADPAAMRASYRDLAAAIPADLPGPVLLVGMAETAVALSTGVFAAWLEATGRQDAVFLHTTRYALGRPRLVEFREDHSHAADHILYTPADAAAAERLGAARSLVLIDDEMTSGRTFANLAAALAPACPHLERRVGVVLTDWRGSRPAVGEAMETVSLLSGTYAFAADPDFTVSDPPDVTGTGALKPFLKRNDGRLGIAAAPVLEQGWLDRARALGIGPGDRVLVLGTGEFVYPPFLLAEAIAEALGADVRCQATTRSPVLPGHAIGHVRTFTDNYADGIPNFLYNVPPGAYDHVILCTETPAPPVGLAEDLGAAVFAMGDAA